MSSMSEILKIKGNKELLIINNMDGKPWMLLEDGGIYKEYEYLIAFNDLGFRLGYISIKKGHKYDDDNLLSYDIDIDCHGGLTFCGRKHDIKEDLLPNIYDDLWIGFDCGHCDEGRDFDRVKKYFGCGIHNPLYLHRREIKDYKYVENECHHIIDQLIEEGKSLTILTKNMVNLILIIQKMKEKNLLMN